MTKLALKEKLISTNCVHDDEYLNLYVDLMYDNLGNKRIKFETEKHHIIPKSYFKQIGVTDRDVIDSCDNLVNLSYKNHILAHYYLYKCASDDVFKSNNLISVVNMTHEKAYKYELDGILSKLGSYDELRSAWLLRQSMNQKGKKIPKISAWLREHHFDCSGENNSRATKMYVYDLKTHELIKHFNVQCVASQELGIPHLKDRVNKSRHRIYVHEGIIIAKSFPLNEEGLMEVLNLKNKHKERIRTKRNFICPICGDDYCLLLNDSDYDEYKKKLSMGKGCCPICNKNGALFRGKKKSDSHKAMISRAAMGRHWITDGISQRQVHNDVLNEYLAQGWHLGKLHNN